MHACADSSPTRRAARRGLAVGGVLQLVAHPLQRMRVQAAHARHLDPRRCSARISGMSSSAVERALHDYDQRRTRLAATGTTLLLGLKLGSARQVAADLSEYYRRQRGGLVPGMMSTFKCSLINCRPGGSEIRPAPTARRGSCRRPIPRDERQGNKRSRAGRQPNHADDKSPLPVA